MVLAIKLTDNIFVPQIIINNVENIFGENYSLAQDSIRGVYTSNNDLSFTKFFNDIKIGFEPTLIFNLYHLVNSQIIADELVADKRFNDNQLASNPDPNSSLLRPLINYLNLFGFEIRNRPSQKQLLILKGLKILKIIQEYWLEGETFRSESFQNNVPKLDVGNNYLQNFNYFDIPERGAGASLIIIEPDATNDLEIIGVDVNIDNFMNGTISLNTLGDMRFGDIHQNMTLSTLYGDKEKTLEGLVPKANLVVCSLNKSVLTDNLTTKFKSKKSTILNLLRSILLEINAPKFQNSVLLFEFETWIPLNKNEPNTGENFPSFIIWDVKNLIDSLAKKRNIIVIGGAGDSHKNFDILSPFPWKNKGGYSYVDLNQPELPFIMVSGVDKKQNSNDFTINSKSNYGKNVDVYMYTNFNLGKNELFGGASGASAAMAGVATYLQGKALLKDSVDGLPDIQNRKPLTIQLIKKIIQMTFMNKFPKANRIDLTDKTTGLITPIHFAELWKLCNKLLNSPVS